MLILLFLFFPGTLVEFDPLCIPMEKDTRSINVISLDEKDVKVSVLLKELEPIQSKHYELLLPLTPIQRHDLYFNEKWRSILEVKVFLFCVFLFLFTFFLFLGESWRHCLVLSVL